MAMQYELVLQFALAPRDVARFDRITEFENRLERRREHPTVDGDKLYALDGSDCKLGYIEVRLVTNDPPRAFEAIRGTMPQSCPCEVGYRAADSGDALAPLP